MKFRILFGLLALIGMSALAADVPQRSGIYLFKTDKNGKIETVTVAPVTVPARPLAVINVGTNGFREATIPNLKVPLKVK